MTPEMEVDVGAEGVADVEVVVAVDVGVEDGGVVTGVETPSDNKKL